LELAGAIKPPADTQFEKPNSINLLQPLDEEMLFYTEFHLPCIMLNKFHGPPKTWLKGK